MHESKVIPTAVVAVTRRALRIREVPLDARSVHDQKTKPNGLPEAHGPAPRNSSDLSAHSTSTPGTCGHSARGEGKPFLSLKRTFVGGALRVQAIATRTISSHWSGYFINALRWAILRLAACRHHVGWLIKGPRGIGLGPGVHLFASADIASSRRF